MGIGDSREAQEDAPGTSPGPVDAPGGDPHLPPDWVVTSVQRDDLELLLSGGYAPLTGFLTRSQAALVRVHGRLPDGTPWPVPVTLEVDAATARAAESAGRVSLREEDGTRLADLVVEEVWTDGEGWHLAGPVRQVRPPLRPEFPELRRTVGEIRAESLHPEPRPVVVAQPVGPVDARTARRWARAAAAVGGELLLFPPEGGEPEQRRLHRIRAHRHLLAHLPDGTRLRLLPSSRPAEDPLSPTLHAVVARNAGGTHLLLHDLSLPAAGLEALGLTPLDPDRHQAPDDPPPGVFHDEVAAELERANPPRARRGLVILLSGLSGSGKSTIGRALRARLLEPGDRAVTFLDGDLVRRHLSKGLGFSREDRDLNVRRIGFVAAEIARHGGTALCAPIAPYDRTRRAVRSMVEEAGGGFVLVHVATPLEVCEERDVKGLYARARAGELRGLTGVDDPYEEPTDAEVVVDTSRTTAADGVERILDHLREAGWYRPEP